MGAWLFCYSSWRWAYESRADQFNIYVSVYSFRQHWLTNNRHICTLAKWIGTLDSIKRTYPPILGANIYTTVTSILEEGWWAQRGSSKLHDVILSSIYLSEIMILYVIPFIRKILMKDAQFLGNTPMKYYWFSFIVTCLIYMFFVFSLSIFGLSVASFCHTRKFVIKK